MLFFSTKHMIQGKAQHSEALGVTDKGVKLG